MRKGEWRNKQVAVRPHDQQDTEMIRQNLRAAGWGSFHLELLHKPRPSPTLNFSLQRIFSQLTVLWF